MHTSITTKLINTLQPAEKPYEIRDHQLKGLLLRVQPSGVMTYYLEYKRGKRTKLGRADAITPFQARELAKDLLSDVYKGEDPNDKRKLAKAYTFQQFLDEVYDSWMKANLRTGAAALERLKASFNEFDNLKLHEINPWLIEKWRLRRQKDGVKATTINRELADLKACLARATQWGVIDSHPIEKVKLCKIDSNAKVRYLSHDEEVRLREALDKREETIRLERKNANKWRAERGYKLYPSLDEVPFVDHLKPAVLLSLNTGLRRGELFGLKWEDINFNQYNLTVIADTAKSGKTRHIPLNNEAISVFKEWKSQQPPSAVYVFEDSDGKPFHDVRTSWEGVLKEAAIEKFRWHDMRHTFASKLVMADVDLNTVRELLGHSDYKMTLRYAHLAPEHKMLAVQKLSSI